MFWGSISGRYGRLRGLFWEKDWETINEGSYAGIIIPVIQEILQEHPELILQQDNAKGILLGLLNRYSKQSILHL
jgi:hypothetical protein